MIWGDEQGPTRVLSVLSSLPRKGKNDIRSVHSLNAHHLSRAKSSKGTHMKKQSNATVYSSADELARELGVSRTAIYAGLRAGTIRSIRLGKRFILPRAAIARWA
jgi:excisionase family DNA binding protein